MKTSRILATSIALLLTTTILPAQTWDGGGAAGGVLDWISSANWNLNVVPLNDGTANIIFAGTIDNDPGPNLDQNWSVNSVTFNNTAGAFVLGSTGVSRSPSRAAASRIRTRNCRRSITRSPSVRRRFGTRRMAT